MGYNFPDAPAADQVFAPAGGPSWIYRGGAWMQQLPPAISGPVTGATFFNSRAQAVDSPIAGDVQSITLHGYYAPGDHGGAMYVRVGSEPTHAGKLQSADGAWWEIREKIYTPQMFGAKGDGVNDDYPAVNACIQMPGGELSFPPNYPNGPTVFIPSGSYRMTSAGRYGIQLKQRTNISGEMTGQGNAFPGSALLFPIHCNGFTVHQHNTIDNITETVPTGAGASSIIEKIAIYGTFSGADGDYHGIRLRARATLRDLFVSTWDGDCIHINAQAGGGGNNEGNANNFVISTVGLYFAGRHGLFVEGPDANAGVATMVNAMYCGRFGIYDSSFLGNTYIGCHTANNGAANSGQNKFFTPPRGAIIYYDGHRYNANTNDETLLATTVPGTDPNVWQDVGALGPHAIYVNWALGHPVGTYFNGGAYKTDGAAAQNLLLGCYMEGAQGSAAFVGGTIVLGGTMHYNAYSEGSFIQGFDGNSIVARGTTGKVGSNYGGTTDQFVGGDSVNGTILSWDAIWRFQRQGPDFKCAYANSSSLIPFEITGNATTRVMGTTTPKPYLFTMRRMALGIGNDIRRQSTGTAAPTTEEWAKGDIRWNIGAGLNNNAGWICTTGGTPGTWTRFGMTTGQEEVSVDANHAISVGGGNQPNILFTGTLTANRTLNVSNTGGYNGARFRLTRTGVDVFNLIVMHNGVVPLKSLATNTWCEVVHNGSAWYLSAYGTL